MTCDSEPLALFTTMTGFLAITIRRSLYFDIINALVNLRLLSDTSLGISSPQICVDRGGMNDLSFSVMCAKSWYATYIFRQ